MTTDAAETPAAETPADPRGMIFIDPVAFADMDRWHATAAELRREAPVLRVDAPGWTPFYALTRHEDVLEVSRRSDLYRNTERAAPAADFQYEMASLAGMPLPKSLVHMDGDEHTAYRKVTNEWFKPAAVKPRQPAIDAIADEFLDRLVDLGGECDFAKDIAVPFTMRVIMSIFGIPTADEPLMLSLTQGLFGAMDPEYLGDFSDPLALIQNTVTTFQEYFDALTADRRACPADDLATVLANGEVGGCPLGERELLWYYIIVATAGHDTTSYALSGGLEQLLRRPEQWAALAADPELATAAAEESIRWTSPVRCFFRFPTEDVTIRGVDIPANVPVLLSYPSANRDEQVFSNPDTFDIRRPDVDRLISFGLGVHYCLGSQFARREVRTMLGKLAQRVSSIELAGEVEYSPTYFVSGVKSLPIRYTLR